MSLDLTLRSWLSLYDFSTAYRLAAYESVSAAVASYRLPAVGKLIKDAVAEDKKLRAQEVLFAQEARASEKGNPAAVALDTKLDRLLSAIPDAAKVAKASADAEEERDAIDAFVERVFPHGLADVVNARYVDELSFSQSILEVLSSNAAMVKRLALGPVVAQLKRVVPQFEKAVTATKASRTLGFDELRAARAEGQERFARYIFAVAAAFPSSSAKDVQARRALWGPILKLNEAIAQSLKRGGNPNDVVPASAANEAAP